MAVSAVLSAWEMGKGIRIGVAYPSCARYQIQIAAVSRATVQVGPQVP